MASVVPLTGASHELPARRVVAFIHELGLEAHDVVPKIDQEPALQEPIAFAWKKKIPAFDILRYVTRGIFGSEWYCREREECRLWRVTSECFQLLVVTARIPPNPGWC